MVSVEDILFIVDDDKRDPSSVSALVVRAVFQVEADVMVSDFQPGFDPYRPRCEE